MTAMEINLEHNQLHVNFCVSFPIRPLHSFSWQQWRMTAFLPPYGSSRGQHHEEDAVSSLAECLEDAEQFLLLIITMLDPPS
jgi:hypothetical protein